MLTERLHRLPLFAGLDDAALEQLADLARVLVLQRKSSLTISLFWVTRSLAAAISRWERR